MIISKSDVLAVYDYFKREAFTKQEHKEYDLALKSIETCAKLAYEFNYFYTDPELENILASIADVIGQNSYEGVEPIKAKYALIDTNGSDNHGLTQQYIRALIAAEVEFVYIYEDLDLSRIKIIIEEIKAYPKATIYTFDRPHSDIEKVKMLLSFLKEYQPEKFIMHIMPWDVVAIMLCNLLKGVTTYNINATDHAFWLGGLCIDYCIEFRNYGYTVSLEKRGLKKEQLLLLPYYPMLNNASFKGFPESIANDKIKMFSGGSFYKIYGDGGKYFEIVKRLLTDNTNTVLLYAGTGNDLEMRRFIKQNNFEDRIYLLGNRTDIAQVFAASDIYLGTYPISGGLMSQYAAINGKPILAYTDPKLGTNFVESLVCHEIKLDITFTNLEEFYNRASQLCNHPELRSELGNQLKNGVISAHQFNQEFAYMLRNNVSERAGEREYIDYASFSALYLEVENSFQPSAQMLVASVMRLKLAYKFPKIFINVFTILIWKFLNVKWRSTVNCY